jgi:CelD/BcsL family acetyltransferase involved in cellulose biosynthesis
MIERHDTLEELAPEWEALADGLEAPPFVRPGWIAAWIGAFGRGRTVVLGVRREDRLVGVVPLLTRRGALYSPTNSHTPAFDLLALDRGAVSELAHGVLALGAHRVVLSYLDPDEQAFAAWREAAERRRHRTLAWVTARAPYVSLDGEWTEYRGSLERKFRKELGRLARRMDDSGRVEFVVDEGSDRWPELLEEGLRIEGSGWKTEAGTAILSRPETARFYRDVAAWAAERGWLRLKFLRLDGRAVAFDLVLEVGGTAHVLKGGFDPAMRQLGPGTLLTERSLQRAFELGLHSYELHGTDDAYKLRWTRTTRARAKTQAFRRSLPGRLAHLAFDHGRPLYRRVRGNEPVERLGPPDPSGGRPGSSESPTDLVEARK